MYGLERELMKSHQHMIVRFGIVVLLNFAPWGAAQSTSTIIQDVPFSANEWITRTAIESGGGVSVTTQQIAIARASDGTERREIHEASAGTDRVVGTSIVLVSILNRNKKAASAISKGRQQSLLRTYPGYRVCQKHTRRKIYQ
jgi:hypothetical protein